MVDKSHRKTVGKFGPRTKHVRIDKKCARRKCVSTGSVRLCGIFRLDGERMRGRNGTAHSVWQTFLSATLASNSGQTRVAAHCPEMPA